MRTYLLSYVFLRGRCASCKSSISIRYPIVETITGVLSAYMGWRFGLTLAMAGALVFAWALIALTAIDIDTELLPDDITLAATTVAGPSCQPERRFAPLSSAVIGAIVGYFVTLGNVLVVQTHDRKEGMGYGDFKLLGAIGAWLGWKMLPIA